MLVGEPHSRSHRGGGGLLTGLAILGGVSLLSGCADVNSWKSAHPHPAYEMERMNDWLGSYLGITGLQYLLMLFLSARLKMKLRAQNLVRTLILTPIWWTKLGEWWFRLWHWVAGHGNWGILMTAMFFSITGFLGVGNLPILILAGYIFADRNMLEWAFVPSLLCATLLNLALVVEWATGRANPAKEEILP